MPYYETDPSVLAWFHEHLTDDRPRVRRQALQLLEHVDCSERDHWLERGEADPDPQVMTAAVLVRAVVDLRRDARAIELLEADFSNGAAAEDLQWEWEYTVKVCRGCYVPATSVLAWTHEEDDAAAREIALMKAVAWERSTDDAVPVIIDKRLVTLFTRSPRSFSEAVLWHNQGRPRYRDGG